MSMYPSYRPVATITCGVDGCRHICSNKMMVIHKANKHDIDIQWEYCDQCDLKYRNIGGLRSHQRSKHEPPRPVLTCSVDGCKYHTKSKSTLSDHVRYCGKKRIQIVKEFTNRHGEKFCHITVTYE